MALCPICQYALPETPVPTCPNCGADLASLPMEPPPPSGGPSGTTPQAGGGSLRGGRTIPWEERDRLGMIAALIETTRQVLFAPSAFFRAMPVSGGMGSPLGYAVIVGWIGVVAASFYQAVFRTVLGAGGSAFADRPEVAQLLNFVGGWAGFVGQVVFGGVFVLIGVFLSAGVFHVMLMLLGGARQGFEATLRAVSYAQATSLIFLLPFCGQPIGAVWALVLYVIGLAEAHRIGHGKAVAAVLLPLVIICCCCAGIGMMIGMGAAGLASHLR